MTTITATGHRPKSLPTGYDLAPLIALWNGGKGGTGNCIEYAEKKGKRSVNLWGEYSLDL